MCWWVFLLSWILALAIYLAFLSYCMTRKPSKPSKCPVSVNYHFTRRCNKVVLGENDSERRLRDARRFLVGDEAFAHFCDVHRGQRAFVPELNALMAKSYLILDEHLLFLDRDGREPSPSILEVGVQKALESVYWDEKSFISRGGIYDWSRDQRSCSDTQRDLDW